MTPRRITRLTLAFGAIGATLGVAACGGGTLGSSSEEATGPVKIGLLVPQSGVYKSLGDDMKAGFEVYLKEKGNKLGGTEVRSSRLTRARPPTPARPPPTSSSSRTRPPSSPASSAPPP